MSRELKNDKSECYIFNFNNGREDAYYMCQVIYNDGKQNIELDTDIRGYYLVAVNVEYDRDTGKPFNPNMMYSDLRLIVECPRRSEKNFQLALDKLEEVARESIEIMEADKKYLQDLADENEMSAEDVFNRLMKAIEESEKKEKEEHGMKFENKVKPLNNKRKKEKGKDKKKVTFDDVAGLEDVKETFLDVIDQLKNPEKYEYFDIEPIKSLLLYGQPGTGKTFIANAFANEIDANFIKVNMGDIASKYQGQTGNNIKRIFDEARDSDQFVVLFWDEVDAVANRRGAEENSKEKNATLNVLLTEMSSEDNDNIFMIFATNFYDLLDPAFLRSGRCDVKIEIPLPNLETRLQVLELNTKRKPLGEDTNLKEIAKMMEGSNCADVSLLCTQTARCALKKDKMEINQEDFIETLEKMNMKKKRDIVKKIGFESQCKAEANN